MRKSKFFAVGLVCLLLLSGLVLAGCGACGTVDCTATIGEGGRVSRTTCTNSGCDMRNWDGLGSRIPPCNC